MLTANERCDWSVRHLDTCLGPLPPRPLPLPEPFTIPPAGGLSPMISATKYPLLYVERVEPLYNDLLNIMLKAQGLKLRLLLMSF